MKVKKGAINKENIFYKSLFPMMILETSTLLGFVISSIVIAIKNSMGYICNCDFLFYIICIFFVFGVIVLILKDSVLNQNVNYNCDSKKDNKHFIVIYALDFLFLLLYLCVFWISKTLCGNVEYNILILCVFGTLSIIFVYLKVVKDETRKSKDKYSWINRHMYKRHILFNEWISTVGLVISLNIFKILNFDEQVTKMVTLLIVGSTSVFAEQSLFIKYISNIVESENEKEHWNKKVDKMIEIIIKRYNKKRDSNDFQKNLIDDISKSTSLTIMEIDEIVAKIKRCFKLMENRKLQYFEIAEVTGINENTIKKLSEISSLNIFNEFSL